MVWPGFEWTGLVVAHLVRMDKEGSAHEAHKATRETSKGRQALGVEIQRVWKFAPGSDRLSRHWWWWWQFPYAHVKQDVPIFLQKRWSSSFSLSFKLKCLIAECSSILIILLHLSFRFTYLRRRPIFNQQTCVGSQAIFVMILPTMIAH